MNLIYHELSPIVLHIYVVDQWPELRFPMNFNAFLEKAKLKDDGSNYTDWVHNLRITLIAAQKNYVLDALLGDRPAAGADADECLASSI